MPILCKQVKIIEKYIVHVKLLVKKVKQFKEGNINEEKNIVLIFEREKDNNFKKSVFLRKQ